MEALARLRQLLSKEPIVNHWWDCVDLLCDSEESEQALLLEYLLEHVMEDPGWNRSRVPCGDWEPEYPGWGLCEVTSQEIEVLPQATELYCPPGTFRMGASPDEHNAGDDEKPAREVSLTRGFWALSTPVTEAMVEAVVRENFFESEGWRRPVHDVSWHDAVVFCNQLSEKAGLPPAYRFVKRTESQNEGTVLEYLQDSEGYRLPTEAEWEYLCRAGSTKARYGELDDIAWYAENSDGGSHPVGQKEPNAWGFYDTLGNVWEWCADEYDVKAYSKLPQVNPASLPQVGFDRVLRGGCEIESASDVRASSRFGSAERIRFSIFGFRVVRTSKVKTKP